MRGRVSATALRAGATLSVALLAFGPASAQSVSISTDQSTPVDIPDGYDFSNTATIDVDLTFFDPAVTALGSVPVFVNGSTGVIVSQGSNAVELFDVGSFNNLGSISAYDLAVGADHIGDFNNSGSIQGLFGLQAGRIDTFANSGTISGDEVAVMIYGAPRSFSNSGSIVSAGTIGSSDGIGVILVEGVGSFVNTGTIYGYSAGVMIGANADPSVTTAIVNSGTIETDPCGCGLFGLAFSGGTLVNSGTISSAMGVLLVPGGSQNTTVTNSGTIEGTAPVDSLPFAPFSDLTVAMLFDSITPTEDVLRLLPGSRILGAVGFGPGEDTLDLTRYQGSSFQLYYDLENVLTGGGIILDSHSPDLRMVGTIDDTAVRSFGAAQFGNHASMLLAAIGSARGSAGGPVPSELGYLPSAAQSDAAVAAGMLATPLPGPRVWGAALGGASADATVGNSWSQLLGGVVAGADVAAGNGGLAGGLVNLGAGHHQHPWHARPLRRNGSRGRVAGSCPAGRRFSQSQRARNLGDLRHRDRGRGLCQLVCEPVGCPQRAAGAVRCGGNRRRPEPHVCRRRRGGLSGNRGNAEPQRAGAGHPPARGAGRPLGVDHARRHHADRHGWRAWLRQPGRL